MASTKVQFRNAAGVNLAGLLDRPGGLPRATALFAHCFTCSKDIKAAHHISSALTAAGFAVLRFDFTGLGQSEGEFAASNFSANVADLVAAAEFLREQKLTADILIGHSLGGAAVLAAAPQIDGVRAVATIAAPSRPAHVKRMFANAQQDIDVNGEAKVDLGGRPFTIRKQFIADLDRQSLPESIGALRKPLMIFHAPLDAVVSIDNASELFQHAKHPKSFVSLDDADHLLSRNADAVYVGNVLAAWAGKYLPDSEINALTADDGEVVARTPAGGFRTDLRAGRHALLADEPLTYGGTDLGPTPYDLLGAALASCTTMTLQMYARQKKLQLDSVTARVTHSKIHASDCADCENREGKVDEFRRVIDVEGDLTAEQRQRLLEIADRCPVHRTLHGEIKVRSSLAAD
jgi:uncharacterized OsmC-like protein/alpha-beta hydrolase superfamily lysophospholipase